MTVWTTSGGARLGDREDGRRRDPTGEVADGGEGEVASGDRSSRRRAGLVGEASSVRDGVMSGARGALLPAEIGIDLEVEEWGWGGGEMAAWGKDADGSYGAKKSPIVTREFLAVKKKNLERQN